jgi:glycosyltransferase involved in cell wall biosynthesis
MRIAVISTTIMVCPPPGYSGLEMLAWLQAEGLRTKGHDVTLIAPHGSATSCELHGTTIGESEQQAFSGYQHKLSGFDVVIDNSWQKWSYMAKREGKIKTPILGVLHAPVNTMYSSAPLEKSCFIAISKDQGQSIKEHLGCDHRVAYNGIDVNFYKPINRPRNNRYLFLARFSSIKGPHIAADVARKTKVALDMVGDDTLTGEPALVQQVREVCTLTPGLRYIGPQNRAECVHWFNTNKAMLHPNQTFREPFGLAPLEAQLCGMPVIAWDNGAMRETIKVGETGFLVKTQEEMEDLVRKDAISSIKPSRCREWASQFSVQKMVDRYDALCKEALDTGGW